MNVLAEIEENLKLEAGLGRGEGVGVLAGSLSHVMDSQTVTATAHAYRVVGSYHGADVPTSTQRARARSELANGAAVNTAVRGSLRPCSRFLAQSGITGLWGNSQGCEVESNRILKQLCSPLGNLPMIFLPT